jgi:hypothetical protein
LPAERLTERKAWTGRAICLGSRSTNPITSYRREDLAALFAAGFETIGTKLAFMSKIVTFRREA